MLQHLSWSANKWITSGETIFYIKWENKLIGIYYSGDLSMDSMCELMFREADSTDFGDWGEHVAEPSRGSKHKAE